MSENPDDVLLVHAARDGILHGDKSMRDLWWNALGLGDTSWWRMWERNWPPQAP